MIYQLMAYIYLSVALNYLIKMYLSLINKLYGNLTYSLNIDDVNYNDQFIDETESYIRTIE